MELDETVNSRSSERSSYKFAIIGQGMIGTAAAKYLGKFGSDVVLIGADEGNGIHGACYDEGRIYRILDHNLNWSKLAKKSIDEYQKISSDTGVPFYKECGILIMGKRGNMFVQDTLNTSNQLDLTYTRMSADGITEEFPYLQIPTTQNVVGLHMKKKAGIFSSRKMMKAQCMLAEKAGVSFIREHAQEVRPLGQSGFEIKLMSGRAIQVDQVLVAAGVFTTLLPLLPPPALDIELVCTQTINVEPDEDTLRMLEKNKMPAIIYEGQTKEDFMFIEPPIEYPDGKKYLKIGSASAFNSPLYGYEQVQAWFERGECTNDFKIYAQRLLLQFFPYMKIQSIKDMVCVTDHTRNEQPYIDMVAPGWYVATGGNGWAAKSSDHIGYLAAQMMVKPESFLKNTGFPFNSFRAHYIETSDSTLNCDDSTSYCGIS